MVDFCRSGQMYSAWLLYMEYWMLSLQLYNFGETVSLVMWSDSWQPDSYVDKIDRNLLHGNHTLCLLGTPVTCK